MGALSEWFAVAGALAAMPQSVPADPPSTTQAAPSVSGWSGFVEAAALRFGLPPAWIWRVMRAESGGRTMLNGRPITSPKGAMGLMQVMPATYAEMARRHGLGADPHDPRDNILAGAAYLRLMYDRFGYPGLFAAYNAGPARYLAFLEGRQPLPRETRSYLAQVAPGAPAAFAAEAPPGRIDAYRASPPRDSGLFYVRQIASAGAVSSDDATRHPAPPGGNGSSIFVQLQTREPPAP